MHARSPSTNPDIVAVVSTFLTEISTNANVHEAITTIKSIPEISEKLEVLKRENTSLTAQLEDCQEKLDALGGVQRKALKQKDSVIAERDKKIADLVRTQRKALDQKDSAITERDKKIANLERTQCKALGQKDSAIAERDKKIADLERIQREALDQQDLAIAERDQKIADKEKQIEGLAEQISILTFTVEDLDSRNAGFNSRAGGVAGTRGQPELERNAGLTSRAVNVAGTQAQPELERKASRYSSQLGNTAPPSDVARQLKELDEQIKQSQLAIAAKEAQKKVKAKASAPEKAE